MPTTLSAFQVVALKHKHSENAAASEFLADYLAFTRLSAAGASADRFAIICCKLVAFLSCAAPTASDGGISSPSLGSVLRLLQRFWHCQWREAPLAMGVLNWLRATALPYKAAIRSQPLS